MSDFYIKFARILNSGQSRSVVFHGNVYDLFWDGEEYVPLIALLLKKTAPAGLIQIVYELNGPIRIADKDQNELKKAWVRWKSVATADHLFARTLGRVRIDTEI